MSEHNRFKCGWCGHPTTEDGHPLSMSMLGTTKMAKDWAEAKEVNGLCCAAEMSQQYADETGWEG